MARPANLMTHRRQQVLERYKSMAAKGEKFSLARMARECGLYDYRDARRVMDDLKAMGAI